MDFVRLSIIGLIFFHYRYVLFDRALVSEHHHIFKVQGILDG